MQHAAQIPTSDISEQIANLEEIPDEGTVITIPVSLRVRPTENGFTFDQEFAQIEEMNAANQHLNDASDAPQSVPQAVRAVMDSDPNKAWLSRELGERVEQLGFDLGENKQRLYSAISQMKKRGEIKMYGKAKSRNRKYKLA